MAKKRALPVAGPAGKRDNGTQLKRVRRICTSIPGTIEKISHGAPTFFTPKRVFAMFVSNHHGDGHVAVWVPASGRAGGINRGGARLLSRCRARSQAVADVFEISTRNNQQMIFPDLRFAHSVQLWRILNPDEALKRQAVNRLSSRKNKTALRPKATCFQVASSKHDRPVA